MCVAVAVVGLVEAGALELCKDSRDAAYSPQISMDVIACGGERS